MWVTASIFKIDVNLICLHSICGSKKDNPILTRKGYWSMQVLFIVLLTFFLCWHNYIRDSMPNKWKRIKYLSNIKLLLCNWTKTLNVWPIIGLDVFCWLQNIIQCFVIFCTYWHIIYSFDGFNVIKHFI